MTSSRTLRVRAHELRPHIADLAANATMIEAAIRDAVRDRIDLLVLPELATSGYHLRDAAEARGVAIDAGDPLLAGWAALLAPGMVTVLGFAERDGSAVYNSAAVLGPQGVLAVYRKTHLWDAEKELFTPGSAAPPVLDTPVGRLGVLICYDLEFPEMPRGLALAGADLVAVPTNWPLVPRPAGEHAPEVVMAMAAARASGLAIVCCDRAGTERGGVWTEGTTVIGTDGWPVGTKDESGRVDVDLTVAADRHTIGPRNHLLGDRRPELYAG